MVFDRLIKALLAVIAAALWANALALWIGPRAATASAANVIKAQQFVVVDEAGNERATLSALSGDSTELRLRAAGEKKDGITLRHCQIITARI